MLREENLRQIFLKILFKVIVGLISRKVIVYLNFCILGNDSVLCCARHCPSVGENPV